MGLGIGLRAGNWGLGVRSYGWCALVASTGKRRNSAVSMVREKAS